MTVEYLKNAEVIEELDRLKEKLLSGECSKFYAFTDAIDVDDSIFYAGDWDYVEIVGSLGALHTMEMLELHRQLFSLNAEDYEEDDFPED